MFGFPQQPDRANGPNSSFQLSGTTLRGTFILPESYNDPVGVTGIAATAQIVKAIPIRRDSLNPNRRRMTIRTLIKNPSLSIVIWTLSLNGVTINSANTGVSALPIITYKILYVDPFHAHIVQTEYFGGAAPTSPTIQLNVAGFDWAADQQLALSQNNVASSDLTVYQLQAEVTS